jgi:hypothetical protein
MTIQNKSYLQQYLDRVSGNSGVGSAATAASVVPEMATASVYGNGMFTGSGNITTAFEQMYRRKQILASAVSWWNPLDDNVYLTETDDNNPHYDHKVYNMAAYLRGRKILATASADPSSVSSTDIDKARYGAFESQWQDLAVQYNESKMQTAGAITSKDFLGITTSVVQGELLDLDRREYVLDQSTTTLRTDELQFEMDTYNRFQVAEDVGELELTPERAGQFSTQIFQLKKDQGHIAWTQTFSQRTRRQNVLAIHARNVQEDFDRVINERIGTTLALFTDIAAGGATWSAINATHGMNDKDPTLDIMTQMTTIRNNGGVANSIASTNAVYQSYIKNSFVKGAMSPTSSVSVGQGVFPNPPLLSGFTWYVDELLPANRVFVYDKNGIVHIVGPRRTANYSKPELELSGIVINNFDNTVIRTAGFGREVTGV